MAQTATNSPDAAHASAPMQRLARWVVGPYWLLLLVGTHRPRAEDQHVIPPMPLDHILLYDKPIHAVAFGLLFFLLVRVNRIARGQAYARRCLITAMLVAIYSAINEATQHFVPGRTVSWGDLIANFTGILCVYILLLIPARRLQPPKRRAVRIALLLLLPSVAVLFLSPGVVRWIIEARRSLSNETGFDIQHADHLFHGLVALVVSVLTILAWPMASRRPRRAALLAILILLFSAPGIEIAQHFTGRSAEIADARAHILGACVALIWWAVRLTRDPMLRQADVQQADRAHAQAPADLPATDPTEARD